MLNMDDVRGKFGSFEEFKKFHNDWERACCLINPKIKGRMEHSKKVLDRLEAQKEGKQNE